MEARHLLSITVNTLVDENDGINIGGVSLRDALAEAYSRPGADVIDFDASLSGTITLANGELWIGSDVEIRGPGANRLVLDAHAASRVIQVGSANVTIRGLTITGGGNVNLGAGIRNYGDLTLDSVRVTNNKTYQLSSSVIGNDQGGGILNDNGSLHIFNSEIDANESRWHAGIAFYANDANDTLEIVNSLIDANMARDADGWNYGGGIVIDSTTSAAVLKIINSTISGNKASGGAGMGV